MKARIKHTDIIIDSVREPLGWLWNSIQGKVYLDKEELEFLDNDDNFDWQSFRVEAAKDILCAMIAKFGTSSIDMNDVVKWADSLIAKLKEKGGEK